MISLENEFLRVQISPEGAELKSVFSVKNQLEYIWGADPRYWNRSAPHLFPIVGALNNNTYRHNGKSYLLPRHGFVRDMPSVLVEHKNDSAEFEFCANEDTLNNFPFHFSLRIRFALENSSIKTKYLLFNPDAVPLLYSLGAHPGFCLHDKMENYAIEFDQEESTQRYFVDRGLISTENASFNTLNKRIFLKKGLFKKDAMVFKDLRSKRAKLYHINNERGVELTWDEKFKFFGVWTQPDCETFICLEPWAGIADHQHFNGDLHEKEGIRSLPPYQSETFELNYSFL